VAAGEILRHQSHRFGVGDHLSEVDGFLADGTGHDVADCRFGDKTQAHQLAADWNIVLFLFSECNAELIRRHQTLLNQQFA
jgi:hypothetical protein